MNTQVPVVAAIGRDELLQAELSRENATLSEEAGISPVNVTPLIQDDYPAWNDFVASSPAATVFHELGWMTAVCNVYRHRPHYLMARSVEGSRLRGILPLFEVRGPFTGHALISTPYAVNGGVVAGDAVAESALVQAAQDLARKLNVKYMEIRQSCGQHGMAEKSHHFAFRKTMAPKSADVLLSFPRKARAAIRHAIDRHKLTSQFGPHLLGVFNKLYVASLRRQIGRAHV